MKRDRSNFFFFFFFVSLADDTGVSPFGNWCFRSSLALKSKQTRIRFYPILILGQEQRKKTFSLDLETLNLRVFEEVERYETCSLNEKTD